MYTFITGLRAFHCNEKVKAKYLKRVRAHAAADQIIQGKYWEKGKGCAVGCTIHGDDHSQYEVELGIPRLIARLEDRIFEGMNLADAKLWPERFLSAIPVGADLSMVWPRFAVWLLTDEKDGVINRAKSDDSKKAIQRVADLYTRLINGDKPALAEWQTARSAVAKFGYWYGFFADAAAADAADADAADAAAAYFYRSVILRREPCVSAFRQQSDTLIKLLAEAPVTK